MKKTAKALLLTSAIVTATAASVGALYKKTVKELMRIALDREEPRALQRDKDKLTGGGANATALSEAINTVMQAAERLKNSDCETIEITADDGIRLIGHFRPAKEPKRVIVAMHGWRSSWAQDFGAISDFWYDNGCSVLYAEQRGQGESGGDYMGFGLLERHDCRAWLRWADERTGGTLPIYPVGISMGATTVLMTAGFENLPASVRGIGADCGFTSPHAIWKHVVENNLHIPYGLYSAGARDICKKKLQLHPDAYSCTDALANCRVPVLFIHGTDDHFVPIEMTYENYKACASPKRLFVVPGAEHGMSYLVDRAGYEAATRAFWAFCESEERQ